LAAWSPDGARIVTTPPPAGEGLTFHDLATRKREHVKLALDATWVRGIDWSHLDRLAVLTKGRSDFKLWTVRPDGTELRTAATDAASSQVSLVGWSADGRAILYKRVRDQVVELVRLEIEPRSGTSGRASILLTTLPSDRDFSIAADGRSLVYVREEGSTNLARWSAGGTPRALTADTRNKYALALSHDRRRIAYAAGAGERTRIFIGPSDGTGATPIPNVEAAILDLDWSPAGTHIAYSVLRDGTPQLWTVDVATGETRRLAHSPMADHGDVAWASPGELLFSALGNAGYRALELATGRERELVPRGLKGWIFSAEPSPDGRQIAVYVNGPNTHGVWSISLDDGGARQLYLERLTPIGWSEDGAWVYVQDSERRLTYAISASGSGEIRSLFALPRPTLGKIRIFLGEHEALAFEEKAQADVWRISLDGPLPSSAFAPVEPLPEPHAQPSLVNPEMSLGAIGSPPPGWSPSPYDGTSVTTDRCLGASAPCASVSHGGWLEQRLVANPYRGKRIRLRVRTRVTGQSSLELRLQAPTRMAHLDTVTATDTAGWHTLEIIADVRPDAQHLIIGLHAAGTSSALYDDVSLEVVER
jgi:Tol biopolymer transport system component